MLSLLLVAPKKEAQKGLFSYAIAWFEGPEVYGLQGQMFGPSRLSTGGCATAGLHRITDMSSLEIVEGTAPAVPFFFDRSET